MSAFCISLASGSGRYTPPDFKEGPMDNRICNNHVTGATIGFTVYGMQKDLFAGNTARDCGVGFEFAPSPPATEKPTTVKKFVKSVLKPLAVGIAVNLLTPR